MNASLKSLEKALVKITILAFSSTAFNASNWAGVPILDRLGQGPLVGVHRGGRFPAANSLLGFEYARKAGVDIIELDLRLSSDGIPMVSHNEELNKFYCRGKVSDHTARYLTRHCRRLWNFQKMNTFEQVLQWAQGRVVINAEFKDINTIKPALRLVEEYQATDWVYFQIMRNHKKYHLARQISPYANLLYRPADQIDLQWALGLDDPHLIIIELWEELLTSKIIDQIHEKGKLISVDTFSLKHSKEIFSAQCQWAYQRQVDIAISDLSYSCVRQASQ